MVTMVTTYTLTADRNRLERKPQSNNQKKTLPDPKNYKHKQQKLVRSKLLHILLMRYNQIKTPFQFKDIILS